MRSRSARPNRRSGFARGLLGLLLLAVAPAAHGAPDGRDWFVRAGSTGDGSQAQPFGDPWQALAACQANDRVHVAEGTYVGRMGTGTWSIPFDGVSLIGGYDAAFRQRDPWQRRARLAWDPKSRNSPQQERLTSSAKAVVVDGLVLDMQDQNGYVDDARSSRSESPGESAMRFTQPVTVRNCVIVNPGTHALVCPSGSTIENNLIVNALVGAVVVNPGPGDAARVPAILSGNTIVFAWDLNAPGRGGYGGAGIGARGPVAVRGNVLAYCDNSAIFLTADPSRVAVTGNVFWRNRFANLTSGRGAEQAVVTDSSMEMLEDVGLSAWEGNVVRDPQLPIDADWQAKAALRPEPPKEEPPPEPPPRWGETKPREIPKGIAPAWDLDRAVALLEPRDPTLSAGARRRSFPVAFAAASTSAPAPSYAPATLTGWNRQPERVHGQRLEMRVARGSVANVTTMPAEFDRATIAGVVLFDPDGAGERVLGFYRKGTQVERVCDELRGRYPGSGRPETVYVVRGVAYAVSGYPKAAFLVESIVEEEPAAPAPVAGARPQGRDWYVRAGSTGGDGSRGKPFRDPFQALERCEAGDTIHVAEGEYAGRLRAGRWRVDMPYVALLGGYDAEFAQRSPWARPTRLVCPADFKGSRGGLTLEGVDDHRGAVVDGFVFDKALNNAYGKDGSLDVAHSDKTEHVSLTRPECAVRNCVFLNGATGALQVANGQTVENNVFVNHFVQVVQVQRGHTTDPCVLRRNTFFVSWSDKPASGQSTGGNLLRLSGDARAVVEDNVFTHADNDAVRLDTDPREVVLRGNVFWRNLWTNVRASAGGHSFGDDNWAQLADLGLRVAERNAILDPDLAVEPSWYARYAAARQPSTPSAPVPAPAPPPVERNPFDDPPDAGRPAPPPAAPTANPFDSDPAPGAGAPDAGTVAAAYDWRRALEVVPRNPACVAGARPVPMTVTFTGVERVEAVHEYVEVPWETASRAESWDAREGQRVMLRLAIARTDETYLLPSAPASTHRAFLAGSPEGTDGGKPLRCYVLRGTRFEREVLRAKGYGSGRPEELHWVKGIAQRGRQLLAERVERSD